MSESTKTLDLEELRQITAEILDVDESELLDDTHFVETLGVDSLMALEVMVVLEKKYKVKLSEDELKEVTTLKKAYRLIESKLGAQ